MNGSENANVTRHLVARAADAGTQAAVRIPRKGKNGIRFEDTNFAELEGGVSDLSGRMAGAGLRKGSRVLVLARPGLELIAGVFAILRLGAVPVVIDPGMGLRAFLKCVERSQPEAVFGVPRGILIARVFRSAFRSVKTRISTGVVRKNFGNGGLRFPEVPADVEDPAAILFTSGSTGPAKGVVYTHGMFGAQIEAVRKRFAIKAGEVDYPMLPVFALFNPALGMTTVVPPMNPGKPAQADPALQIEVMKAADVTNSFGSPVLWRRIADESERSGRKVPSLKRILVAGAALPPSLAARLPGVAPGVEVFSPYGATEALPLTLIDRDAIAEAAPETEAGGGVCVGHPLPNVEVRVVRIGGDTLSAADLESLPTDEVGEIVATGPMVTREYDHLEEATRRAKVPDGNRIWHRMDDLGRIDERGRLWFCGRVVERVTTKDGMIFDPECCEQVFNRHPKVYRSALVGLGAATNRVPGIVIEPLKGSFPKDEEEIDRFVSELKKLGRETDKTRAIKHFFFHKSFPVDVRHNAKIHRLALAKEYAVHGLHPTE